ncbi:enoyl-CoA hydratase [bacterium]|nr:MAG: enoyl-CoA hydratase [bacterium]
MSKHVFETLLLEVDEEGLAVITINRPQKLNALNSQVLSELEDVVHEINDREDIFAAILTGSGEKAFVAGADIAELQDLNAPRGTVAAERGQEVFALIENSTKPFIAAVNGYALGGGCELAMSAHIRIAGEKAVFGLPELSLGLIPGYGGTQRLSRLVGKGRALEFILTGAQIKAEQALAIGLVNKVVAVGEEVKASKEMLKVITTKAPLAVKNAIKAIQASELDKESGYRAEAELFGNLCATEDFTEGTTAFLEKRKPNFTGR